MFNLSSRRREENEAEEYLKKKSWEFLRTSGRYQSVDRRNLKTSKQGGKKKKYEKKKILFMVVELQNPERWRAEAGEVSKGQMKTKLTMLVFMVKTNICIIRITCQAPRWSDLTPPDNCTR